MEGGLKEQLVQGPVFTVEERVPRAAEIYPTSHNQSLILELGPELPFQQVQIGHASSTTH